MKTDLPNENARRPNRGQREVEIKTHNKQLRYREGRGTGGKVACLLRSRIKKYCKDGRCLHGDFIFIVAIFESLKVTFLCSRGADGW